MNLNITSYFETALFTSLNYKTRFISYQKVIPIVLIILLFLLLYLTSLKGWFVILDFEIII